MTKPKKLIDDKLSRMNFYFWEIMIKQNPQSQEKVNQFDDWYFEDNHMVWRKLEDAMKLRKLRAIGVASFQTENFQNFWVIPNRWLTKFCVILAQHLKICST